MALTSPSFPLRGLPKAELHVHLDGSLRPASMLELAGEEGIALPATEPEALARAMRGRTGASLEEYLGPFALTLSLLQEAQALERVAYELVADHSAENVRYVEVRFCPALSTMKGLTSPDVLDAVLRGLSRAQADVHTRAEVIVCGLRSLPPSASIEMAELAVAYRDRGVCAFDLAGSEAGHPVHDHVEALEVASRAGLPITIHAGEAYGPASIREAIELGGAARIGHGTRLVEDPELLARVRERGIALEVCLTSNVQTGAVPSYAAHPVRRYFDDGIPVCLCTDNRLMSGVTLTREYEHAQDEVGFGPAELVRIARAGFEHAFVSDAVRVAALERFDAEIAALQ